MFTTHTLDRLTNKWCYLYRHLNLITQISLTCRTNEQAHFFSGTRPTFFARYRKVIQLWMYIAFFTGNNATLCFLAYLNSVRSEVCNSVYMLIPRFLSRVVQNDYYSIPVLQNEFYKLVYPWQVSFAIHTGCIYLLLKTPTHVHYLMDILSIKRPM